VTVVKVCGLRTLAEARVAVAAGADLLGFILWRPGKRYVAPHHAAEIIRTLRAESAGDWATVGVFVDPSAAEVATAIDVCAFDYVQLSGEEPLDLVQAMPRPTLKAVHVRTGAELAAANVVNGDALGAHLYLLDTHTEGVPGGTGAAFNWHALRAIGPRCLVAGGLRPDNVAGALAMLAPLGVDVSSGVEFPGGGKDPLLIRAFVEAVRTYDYRRQL
jgi:phosphoribosylanthranilate isomerase